MRQSGSPEFSVIIPTYNRAEFLRKAIDSVLNQSIQNHEVIVVDDGSRDSTTALLVRYGGKIRRIRQRNAGVSAARNAGIEAARGAWIAFLDSDDEWRRDYLRQQSRHIKDHPRAVAHITNAITIYPNGSTQEHFEKCLLKKFVNGDHLFLERPLAVILDHAHWYLQSTAIRRDILTRSGVFDQRLTIAEDLDLIARLALEGPFGISREVLVDTYRRPGDGEHLSLQKDRAAIRTCELFEQVYERLGSTDRLNLQERITLAQARSANRRALGNVHLQAGNRSAARASYGSAARAWPSPRSVIKYALALLPGGVLDGFIRK